MSVNLFNFRFPILMWASLVMGLVGLWISVDSLRKKLSAERHFAKRARERNRANRERIRSLVERLSADEIDTDAIQEAAAIIEAQFPQMDKDDRAQLIDTLTRPSARGRAAYMGKLLGLIEQEKMRKESRVGA